MRKIIDGKIYNTETAEMVVTWDSGDSRSDFRYEDNYLYRTKRGNWFLSGEGGPMSRWARRCGSGYSGGSGIQALTVDEAREFVERHGTTAIFEAHFTAEEA
jgi:hypothetical protein